MCKYAGTEVDPVEEVSALKLHMLPNVFALGTRCAEVVPEKQVLKVDAIDELSALSLLISVPVITVGGASGVGGVLLPGVAISTGLLPSINANAALPLLWSIVTATVSSI